MLQSDLNLTVTVEFVAEKPSFYQLETRKCNEIAKVKRSGGNVIYTDLQIVDVNYLNSWLNYSSIIVLVLFAVLCYNIVLSERKVKIW